MDSFLTLLSKYMEEEYDEVGFVVKPNMPLSANLRMDDSGEEAFIAFLERRMGQPLGEAAEIAFFCFFSPLLTGLRCRRRGRLALPFGVHSRGLVRKAGDDGAVLCQVCRSHSGFF